MITYKKTKSQTNESSINAVANRVSALEAQPIITKVTYDATANKFTTGASLQVNGIYLS